MTKITKKTVLKNIVKKPKLRKILEKYQFPCLSCPYAKIEMNELTVGDVCLMYGIDEEKLLSELNKD
ncbi:MAG: DUF1858 domain-containing protein [Patescibacteria group bacterium]|nr:DUF1858 domain-containing protein [Patescibacteria group bacterium]